MPTGAFYATRKACQPLTLIYNYGSNGIYLVNQTLTEKSGLQAVISVFDAESKLLFSKKIPIAALANASNKIFDLPQLENLTPVWFLDLRLQDKSGNLLADNFYWLSIKPDVLDYSKSEWFYTPCKEWADFTFLNNLPPAQVKIKHHFATRGQEHEITVTLRNPGKTIAFGIELSVRGERSAKTIVPVFWADNYVSLIPGESKTVRATFASADLKGEKPIFLYRGWNVNNK
jgi:exo-1,4-beta-D-glucosaminidase